VRPQDPELPGVVFSRQPAKLVAGQELGQVSKVSLVGSPMRVWILVRLSLFTASFSAARTPVALVANEEFDETWLSDRVIVRNQGVSRRVGHREDCTEAGWPAHDGRWRMSAPNPSVSSWVDLFCYQWSARSWR
jgi:hypothetical protein